MMPKYNQFKLHCVLEMCCLHTIPMHIYIYIYIWAAEDSINECNEQLMTSLIITASAECNIN